MKKDEEREGERNTSNEVNSEAVCLHLYETYYQFSEALCACMHVSQVVRVNAVCLTIVFTVDEITPKKRHRCSLRLSF